MTRLLRLSVNISFIFLSALVLRAQTYKAIGEYKLPGASAKGITVDSDGRRLYVAGGDGVTVLDVDTGVVRGTDGGLKDAQDVLLIPVINGDDKVSATKGFASDATGHIVAFSLADLKQTATLKLDDSGPASLCYDMDEKTVEAVSTGGRLTTLDAGSNKVVKSGKMVTGAGQIVCGNMGHVYVTDPVANVVHVLNHDTMQNDGDYPMKTGHKPTGVALDTKGRAASSPSFQTLVGRRYQSSCLENLALRYRAPDAYVKADLLSPIPPATADRYVGKPQALRWMVRMESALLRRFPYPPRKRSRRW